MVKVCWAKADAVLWITSTCTAKVDIEVGTFSKAFGVVGGVVSGSSVIIDWLKQRGRPFLFLLGRNPTGRGCLHCCY